LRSRFQPRILFSTAAPGGSGGAGQNGAADSHIVDVSKENFQAVIDGSATVPTILDAYADWCGPCKQLTPLLEDAVKKADGALRLAKIDTDKNPELAQALQITSLPTVFGLHAGKVVDKFVGLPAPQNLSAFLEKLMLLADPAAAENGAADQGVEGMLNKAEQTLWEEGDAVAASALFNDVLKKEDESDGKAHARAMVGLIQCAIHVNDMSATESLIRKLDSDAKLTKHTAEGPLAKLLADARLKVSAAGNDGDANYRERVEADAEDVEAWYGLAQSMVAAGNYPDAIDAALTVVKLDKTFEEAAGQKLLFQIFDVLGNDHELVVDARKRLSNMLLI